MKPQVTVFRKNPGWAASLLGNCTKIAGKEIAVGFPKGKAQPYPDGEPVASVAAKNCFGIDVTQRDFMSYAEPSIIDKTRETMLKIIRLNNLFGDHTPQIQELQEKAGLLAANCIKTAIRDGGWEPNSDNPMGWQIRSEISANWGVRIPEGMSYRAAKLQFHHKDKPLIDTAHLLNSVNYVVRDK